MITMTKKQISSGVGI